MSEPFCSNEKCMYHRIDIDESASCVELESDESTPIILVDSQPRVLHRASFTLNGEILGKFCETCIGAIDKVHQISKGNLTPIN